MTMFSSSGNLMLSLKVGLFSTCVLSAAMVLKFSVPLISEFVASDVPVFWNVVLQWLKPPYLYLVINCIIISIVASSKLQQKDGKAAAATEKVVLSGDVRAGYDHRVAYGDVSDFVPEKAVLSGDVLTGYDHRVGYDDVIDFAPEKAVLSGDVQTGYESYGHRVAYDDVRDLAPEKVAISGDVRSGGYGAVNINLSEQQNDEKKNVVGGSETAAEGGSERSLPAAPQRSNSMEFLERVLEKEKSREREKPPATARFGQRKALKASPEGGKALKVSKSKRQDTLESTWKTITEGRAMPLTRHLKKSDTWDTHVPPPTPTTTTTTTPPPPKMKKSETFRDGGGSGDNSGRLKKEPSLSQEELNRRVEAFIKKFNEEMRLQRQRSLDQYNEVMMINTN